MFIVEDKKGEKRKAQRLEKYVNASGAKKLTVLDSKGKKIIKNIDKETFELKFG